MPLVCVSRVRLVDMLKQCSIHWDNVSFFPSKCRKTILSKEQISSTKSRRSIRCLVFISFTAARLLRMCSIISGDGEPFFFFFVFPDCIDTIPIDSIPPSSDRRCFSDNSSRRMSIRSSSAFVSEECLASISFNLSINALLETSHSRG